MEEYSRIVIERYCFKNMNKTKKARFLYYLVDKSYDLEFEMNESEALYLEELIERERNQELKEALIDLDNFLCCRY